MKRSVKFILVQLKPERVAFDIALDMRAYECFSLDNWHMCEYIFT